MKKLKNCIIITFIIVFNFVNFNSIGNSMENKTFYDFEIESISGEKMNLNKYNGKAILLVNVASNCGFTKQYSDLQKLWELYKERNFVILAAPSNSFNQEKDDNKEIKDFCETKFNITFPISSLSNVKGKDAHEIYKWAKFNYGNSAVPKWNFHKILIDKNGNVIDTFASFTNPMSKKIIQKIEQIL